MLHNAITSSLFYSTFPTWATASVWALNACDAAAP
jgi:hypothetical protein